MLVFMERRHDELKIEITRCVIGLRNRECVIEATNQRYSAFFYPECFSVPYCPVHTVRERHENERVPGKKYIIKNKYFTETVIFTNFIQVYYLKY